MSARSSWSGRLALLVGCVSLAGLLVAAFWPRAPEVLAERVGASQAMAADGELLILVEVEQPVRLRGLFVSKPDRVRNRRVVIFRTTDNSAIRSKVKTLKAEDAVSLRPNVARLVRIEDTTYLYHFGGRVFNAELDLGRVPPEREAELIAGLGTNSSQGALIEALDAASARWGGELIWARRSFLGVSTQGPADQSFTWSGRRFSWKEESAGESRRLVLEDSEAGRLVLETLSGRGPR